MDAVGEILEDGDENCPESRLEGSPERDDEEEALGQRMYATDCCGSAICD